MFARRIDDDLELRLLEPRDAEALYALVDANRGRLRAWLEWVDSMKTVDDERAFIRASLHDFADGRAVVCGVWLDRRLVGTVGLTGVRDRWDYGEVGYWLAPVAEGRGVATRCVSAVLDHAFADRRPADGSPGGMGLNRVAVRCNPANARSRRVPERLGFTNEGTLRQVGLTGAGEREDLVVYGLLAPEWRGRRGGTPIR